MEGDERVWWTEVLLRPLDTMYIISRYPTTAM